MNWYVSKTLCVRQFEWLEYKAFHHIAITYYGFLPHMKGVLGVRVGSLDREVLGVLVGASACTFASCKFSFWCHGVLIGCFFGPVLVWDLQTKSVAAHLGHKAKPLLVELALMVTWKVCKRVCQFHEKRRHLLSAADNHKISQNDVWQCIEHGTQWVLNSVFSFCFVLATAGHHRNRHLLKIEQTLVLKWRMFWKENFGVLGSTCWFSVVLFVG